MALDMPRLLEGAPPHAARHPQTGWIYCARCIDQAGPERVAEVQARIDDMTAAESARAMPEPCYVCGWGPHQPTELHDYWPVREANAHFDREPSGPLPSMTAAETLDPREARYDGWSSEDFDGWQDVPRD